MPDNTPLNKDIDPALDPTLDHLSRRTLLTRSRRPTKRRKSMCMRAQATPSTTIPANPNRPEATKLAYERALAWFGKYLK